MGTEAEVASQLLPALVLLSLGSTAACAEQPGSGRATTAPEHRGSDSKVVAALDTDCLPGARLQPSRRGDHGRKSRRRRGQGRTRPLTEIRMGG